MKNGNLSSYARERTRRTQEHINESISINYLESFIVRCGFTSERPVHDYGYDCVIGFYDEQGYCENGNVFVQVKAMAHVQLIEAKAAVTYVLERRYLNTWYDNPYPVLFVLYCVEWDEAYWLHMNPLMKAIKKQERDGQLPPSQKTVTLHIPTANRVTQEAIHEWQVLKNESIRRFLQKDDKEL
jgi:hypothetical protein